MRNFLHGFTFIEVMVSILMVGMLLTAIIGMQTTVFQGVVTLSSRFARVISMENRLFESFVQRLNNTWKPDAKEVTQEIKNPETKISYSVKKPSKESALNSFKDIYIEQVRAEWEDGGVTRTQNLINCVHYVETQK